MTRPEAEAMIEEYEDAKLDYRMEYGSSKERAAWAKANAIRERIIDRMCGAETTDVG